ncbi:hypothetical protein ASD56_07495 [Microbacterium sp. Root166]|nr:hypothetical protein ASD56_07495 [Microbacterium sp. Root166]
MLGNDLITKRPTFIYVHGGGFVLGDKISPDPAAQGDGGFGVVRDPIIDAGYNLVSIDYALAPEFKYPVPVIQLSQAIAFLQDHASDYGLNMDQVVIGGASAGGQIVGQFALIESDPIYSERVGIEPVMNGNLKAVVLDSAVIDTSRAGKTQTRKMVTNLLFGLARRAYLGRSARFLREADILGNVTSNYPPTFISDGNTGTFPDQAGDLHNKLNQLGVSNILNVYPRTEVALGHAFMVSPSKFTTDYNRLKVDFLSRILAPGEQ